MYWGSEYVVLYNDAYSTILGGKHPWALGQSCRDCWAEIWDTIGPMLEGVVSSGEATWSKDLLLPLQRHAYSEECYFSFSFSPIRVETGGVGGVFTAVMETTEKVIGERRLRTLRDQAASAVHVKSEPDAWRVSAESLGQNLYDIPFSILFQPSGAAGFSVVGTAGISGTHSLCRELSTPGSDLSEHLRHVAQSREMVELKDLTSLAGALPTGAWEMPPESALLLPIGGSGKDRISGVLFAAVSPRKALDDGYRTFFKLVARQIATSVADARSQDEERKRAEALAEIDRAKTRFFSNVSHEFRTPLTLMLGPLEDTLATADGRLCAEDQEKLLVVHRNTLRLLKLVNSLLDFSRIEAGRVQAVYEPTDLSNLTAELASVFRAAMERSGLRFLVKCEPLPDPIYVDRDMWEKIVLNLLSNAFKYTFKGEVSVTLKAIGDAAVHHLDGRGQRRTVQGRKLLEFPQRCVPVVAGQVFVYRLEIHLGLYATHRVAGLTERSGENCPRKTPFVPSECVRLHRPGGLGPFFGTSFSPGLCARGPRRARRPGQLRSPAGSCSGIAAADRGHESRHREADR